MIDKIKYIIETYHENIEKFPRHICSGHVMEILDKGCVNQSNARGYITIEELGNLRYEITEDMEECYEISIEYDTFWDVNGW